MSIGCVNHIALSGPAVMFVGWHAVEYSYRTPLSVSRPILHPWTSVNQIAASNPAAIPETPPACPRER
jgi:hypothetical protein